MRVFWPMMLWKIIERVRAWARWLGRSSRPSPSASSPTASPDRQQSDTCEGPKGREDTASVANPRDTHSPPARPAALPDDTVSGQPDTGARNDNLQRPGHQDSPPAETPTDQADEPEPRDGQPVETPAIGNEPHGGVFDQPETSVPRDRRSEETSSLSPKGTSADPVSPPTQAGKDVPNAPHDNAEAGDPSPPSSPGSLPAAAERTAAPRRPREIGGKRGPTPRTPRSASQRQRSSLPELVLPELVCRKRSGQWEIVLSVDDERRNVEVHHNGGILDMMNGEYRLPSFVGQLSVVIGDDEPIPVPLFDNDPLIFKLRKNWTGDGRKIGSITKGQFIVIAPREQDRTGHVPVAPEGCTDPNFTAHYFSRNGGEDIGGFQGHKIPLTKSVLELTGRRVFDDSDHGELFGGDDLDLKSAPDISWIRVGEESKDGWRGENFEPGQQRLSEILNGRQGRFFVRAYDFQTELIDSNDFRYLRDLKEIRVGGKPYVKDTILIPSPDGHPSTDIRFVGVDGTTIRPILRSEMDHVNTQEDGLIVQRHPCVSDIRCTLESNRGSVDIVLRLPRVWWRMEHGDGEPEEWRDRPLDMTRQDFRKCADEDTIVRLRLPRRIRSVPVGFDDIIDRSYGRKSNGDGIEIPLAHFVDYTQIDQRMNEDAWFNVRVGEEILSLIQLSADPIPEISKFVSEPVMLNEGEEAVLSWTTHNMEGVCVVLDPEIGVVEPNGSRRIAPIKTSTYTLRLTAPDMGDVTESVTVMVNQSPQSCGDNRTALVKSAKGRWRRGKGFSDGEILDAELTADALPKSIRVDRRRHSVHPVNVETIRE